MEYDRQDDACTAYDADGAPDIEDLVERHADLFGEVSDTIWETPELRFRETRSSALQQRTLEDLGFHTTTGLADMPTAFVARWSSTDGRHDTPVVAFLGEFDALPGLSQEAGVDHPSPLTENAPGHGCGHNLLGSACMEAACALRDWLVETGIPGEVRYYGCPGEESGAGKAFLVRAGCFDDVDVCFSWHPGWHDSFAMRTLANIRVLYSFQGTPSHAASAPHQGRSALDAAELMNMGVQFLREHMPTSSRIHYAFTDVGGTAPNIVQASAKLLYVIRAPRFTEAEQLKARVDKVARGAAMMTETSVESHVVNSYAEMLGNRTLAEIAGRHMRRVLPLAATPEELAEGARFLATLSEEERDLARALAIAHGGTGRPVADFVMDGRTRPAIISTDVGDVSWNVPTCLIGASTAALGTPLHSWQMTAQGVSSLAHRGARAAAAIMASSAAELLQHPELVAQAKADLDAARGGAVYHSLIPDDVLPGSF